MAGKFGKIYKSVWSDPEFLALNMEAQHVYFMLTSSDQTSFAGVVPMAPGRFIGLAKNLTEKKFTAALRELERGNYIVIDKKSLEILVRTFIKWDLSLRNQNLTVAVARAIDQVYSPKLRTILAEQLAKLMGEEPDLRGWEVLAQHVPVFFHEVTEKRLSALIPEIPGAKPEAPSQAPPEPPYEGPDEEGYPLPVRYPVD